jgi:hypothetical protein
MADGRQDNAGALKEVCREFTLLGKKLAVCGRALIAIEGSHCKAGNRQDRHVPESTLKQGLKHIHEKIDTELKALDQ